MDVHSREGLIRLTKPLPFVCPEDEDLAKAHFWLSHPSHTWDGND